MDVHPRGALLEKSALPEFAMTDMDWEAFSPPVPGQCRGLSSMPCEHGEISVNTSL